MVSRTREHELEEESRIALFNYFPIQWVKDEPKSDYGIDYIVNIFEDGNVTPFSFYVQAKASDKVKYSGSISKHSFSTQRLREYYDQSLPFMLVIYDADSRQLYYDWVQNLINSFDQKMILKLKTQDKITIHLQYSLSNLKHEELDKEVRKLFYKMGYNQKQDRLRISVLAQYENEIGLWLSQYQSSKFIEFQNSDSDIQVTVNKEFNQLEIISGREHYFYGYSTSLNANELLLVIKYAVAFSLSIVGRTKYALEILSDLITNEDITDVIKKTFLYQSSLPKFYAKEDRIAEALEMAEFLLEKYENEVAFNLMSAVLTNQKITNRYSVKYRNLLIQLIKQSSNNYFKAAMTYNLANNLSNYGYYKEAIKYYNKASKLDPAYLTREYWFAEIGSCLFNLNRFKWAENYYSFAMKLSPDHTKPLIKKNLGDCLLYQGKFKRASRNFDSLKNSFPYADSLLKSWVSKKLFEKYGDVQRRADLSETKLLEIEKSKFTIEELIVYDNALKYDPLNAFAWHNYAITLDIEDFLKTDSMIIAATMNDWDIEFWAKLVLHMYLRQTKVKHIMFEIVLVVAHSFFQNELEHEMKKNVISDKKINLNTIREIMKLCELFSLRYTISKPVIRRNYIYNN